MKKRYVPDFPAMMRLTEVNYAQLRRLIPRSDTLGSRVGLEVAGTTYHIETLESTRYTSLVSIKQAHPKVSYWSMPQLNVRLYHDALVAEVCSSQQIFRFKASYDYPNKKLHQRDEKHQINQFLADWLRFCLMKGTMSVPVC
ncbi:DUF1249 family protein [Pragia fontium]|uniref:Dehydrogenase n=2 Tax=Pragia fontium TaxID=82985 RepID=A0AAJ4W9W8_9GAMM|nr:DUF1249 family protein [Pragia fontium]AKJ43154.1 dehydrogenase [Pragia fontium]SFC64674.1 hypothetical protein SAMN02745723_103201 [Pragia fontium DSM 5563 = ATCC 49100]SUB83607.1 putative dehydrogenase [Pragia fontium]VEJ56512.1 putative dehydrogenase [Pragia fontium]GKX63453.1 hypothetical protein SOASR032_20220 [Pragia fontium]